MHSYIVNASLQVIPITQDKHPYAWVDEAIEVIRSSGIKYEIGPFATILEGTYQEVMETIHAVNEILLEKNCAEWISNIQIQIRSNGDIKGEEKVAKFK